MEIKLTKREVQVVHTALQTAKYNYIERRNHVMKKEVSKLNKNWLNQNHLIIEQTHKLMVKFNKLAFPKK